MLAELYKLGVPEGMRHWLEMLRSREFGQVVRLPNVIRAGEFGCDSGVLLVRRSPSGPLRIVGVWCTQIEI